MIKPKAYRKHSLRFIRRTAHRRSLWIGLGMAIARLVMFFGVVMLVAWSYSIWGSEHSPLAGLLLPGLALIGVSLLMRFVLYELTRWLARLLLLERRRVDLHRQIRTSREAIQKL
ncbi:hypothetical protein IT570_10440 [Candidatus Sumerlaeota bacterium]|nr:hypothetical protein [Candidatus Sumerlaeota bacterium]